MKETTKRILTVLTLFTFIFQPLALYLPTSAEASAIIYGEGVSASGTGTAIGQNTTASGWVSTAMGNETTASNSVSTAMGEKTTASGWASTAMGYQTIASHSTSTAMGNRTTASADYSTAMGTGTTASGWASTAMGNGTTANGSTSTAMGSGTTASGDVSTSMGYQTIASGSSSTAMGFYTSASANYSTAMGSYTNASGENSVAMGQYTNASGCTSLAAGYNSSAAGDYAVAMGSNASAAVANSFAFGGTVDSAATDGVALGAGSSVTGANSVALGAGSTATEANVVSVGKAGDDGFTRKITNVTAGDLSAGSTEVVVGSQLNSTNQNVATNAGNITTLQSYFDEGGIAKKATADAYGTTINASSYAKSADVAATYATQAAVQDGTIVAGTAANYTSTGTIATELGKKANSADVYTITAADAKFATQTALGNATGVTVNGSNINSGNGIEIAAGENIELTTSGNKLTIKSLGGTDTQAVHYTDSGKTAIELAGTGGTTISNVKAADVASGGTYAATTGQVYNATLKEVTLTGTTLNVSENGTGKTVDLAGLQTTQSSDNATAITNITNGTTTVGNAVNATKDGAGNVIATYYQAKLTTDQQNAVDSGITSTKVGSYDTHVANEDIHVTAEQKTEWSGKQDALTETQLAAANSGITSTGVTQITTNKEDIAAINSSTVMTSGITAEKVTQIGTNTTNITTLQGKFDGDKAKQAINADYATVAGNATNATNASDYIAGGTIETELNKKQATIVGTQLEALNSGITSTKVSAYDTHIANSDIHVTAEQKTEWSGKQDALTETQLAAVDSGIDSTKVAQIGTNTTNITTLQGKFDGDKAKQAINADYAAAAGNATNATNASDYIAGGTIETALNSKQAALNETQLAAVNSGITSTKVSTYDAYDERITTNATDIANIEDGTTTVGKAKDYAEGGTIETELNKKQATIVGDQLEALNSGITATKVSAYDAYDGRITTNATDIANIEDGTTTVGKAKDYAAGGTIETELNKKQATIVGSQLEALNSGITATKVSAYDAYDGRITTNATDIANIEDGTTTVGKAKDYAEGGTIETELNKKQATIVGTQLEALNSGITATKVSTYDKYVTATGLNGNENKITNVAEGDLSDTSTDVVIGKQLNSTNKNVAKNKADIETLNTTVAGIDENVSTLKTRVDDISTTGTTTEKDGNKTVMSATGLTTNNSSASTAVTAGNISLADGSNTTTLSSTALTIGSTAVNGTGITAGTGTGAISFTTSGISAGGQKIQSVGNATVATDAANLGQLQSYSTVTVNGGAGNVNKGSGVNFVAGTNIELKTDETSNNITINATIGGGSDMDAVHYDKDAATGEKSGSVTFLDKDGGTASRVAVKNVDLVADSNNEFTFLDNNGTTAKKVTLKNVVVESSSSTGTGGSTAKVADGKVTVTDTTGSGGTTITSTDITLAGGEDGVKYTSKEQGVSENIQNLDKQVTMIDADKSQITDYTTQSAKAEGKNSTAVGYNTSIGTDAEKSTAVGYNNTVTGASSTAVGTGNIVSGANSGAFGDPNYVTGTGSYAVGNDNNISGSNTFVLGNNVTTNANNSVALGNGSTIGGDDEVSVGSAGKERKISNVQAMAIEKGGTYAATTGQLYSMGEAVVENQRQIAETSKEVKEVGAMSAALAGLHYVEPTGEGDDKFTGAVAYGGYRGESAAAVGVAYKPSPNFMVSASTSVGNNQNMYNAGMSYKFGKGNTAATRASLQKQVKYVNEENQKLKEENAQMKETLQSVLERLEKLEKKQ